MEKKKWKWHLIKIINLSNFCSIMLFQTFCHFVDKGGQRFAVWAPKFSFYVTCDLDFDIRFRLTKATVTLFTFITNYWQIKRYVKNTFDPLWPLIKRPAPFVWYHKKCLVISNIFCSKVFRSSWPFLRYLRKNVLGTAPYTPLRGHLAKNWKLDLLR